MDPATKTQYIAIAIIPLIFAITLHEAAHGFVANYFGDKTAWLLGRVTLNPARHVDPVGTIIVPFLMLIFGGFIFGWAKPVPVNYQNLDNPRRDMALVAMAGPFANFFMALAWGMIARISIAFVTGGDTSHTTLLVANFIYNSARFGIMINCVLLVLNLLPLPPLDGSRVVSSILPPQMASIYEAIEPYGIWILLFLILTQVLQYFILSPIAMLFNLIKALFGLA